MGKIIKTKEYAKFIEKLRKARLEAGLRQIEVAKKVKRPPNLTIAESLAKFLCLKNSKNLWKPEKDFEKNVKKLFDRNFINGKIKKSFDAIWENRHDYHHLNSNILKEHDKLEALAREKIQLLQKVLEDLFEYSIANGKLIPKNQKYWDIKDGKSDVFLNFL